jgi:hypothetical protein
LHEIKEKFQVAVAEGNMAVMIALDTKFHHLIVESSRKHSPDPYGRAASGAGSPLPIIYYKDFKRAEELIPSISAYRGNLKRNGAMRDLKPSTILTS